VLDYVGMHAYHSPLRGFRASFLAAGLFFICQAWLSAQTDLHPVNIGVTSNTLSFNWDVNAPYETALSTVSDFSALTAGGAPGSNTTTYINLDPDTIYYFRVKKQSDGSYNPLYISTVTHAAAPTLPEFVYDFFASDSSDTAQISVQVNRNGNPDWTEYKIEYADNPGFTDSKFYSDYYPPLTLPGLAANTTYFLHVAAVNLSGTQTAPTTDISTATLAIKLDGLGETFGETSATVTWTAVSGPAQAMDSEGYRLRYSTVSVYDRGVIVVWSSTDHDTSSATLTDLERNTTYYYEAGALNWNGAANDSGRSFTTLSSKPQNLQLLGVAADSATLGWAALPPGPSTASALGYRLEASTASNFTGAIFSSSTFNSQLSTLTVSGLAMNTTWYFRAASLNKNFDPNYTAEPYTSAITLASQFSANTVTTISGMNLITVSFHPLDASPQSSSCEGYLFEGSTAPFDEGGEIISSVTYQNQLNQLTLSSLGSYTSYYLRLATLNWEFTPNYTALDVLRTASPGPPTVVILAYVGLSSATLNFTTSLADGYVVEAAAYPDWRFQDLILSSSTSDPGAESLSVTLNENTKYYYRAGALFNGTTFYTNSTPWLQSTLALPLNVQPITGVFSSSITVPWIPLAPSPPNATAERYRLEASASPAFEPVLFSSYTDTISATQLSLTGLDPNTTYYLRAGTLNWDGAANYVNIAATSTLADAPTPAAPPFSFTTDAITVNWLTHSNPADTVYVVDLSSHSDFSNPVSTSTTGSSATFLTADGLLPNTTYYPRVTAMNRFNRATPGGIFPTAATSAFDPAFDNYSDIGVSSITINWLQGLNGSGTKYRAQISSEAAFSGTVLSSVTTALAASFTGLVSNASYYLRVSALNMVDEPKVPPLPLGTALTLPATPYVPAPAQTFPAPDFLIDGFSVNWGDNGNSSSTLYRVQVSTAPDFSVINASVSVNAETAVFSNLFINTTYWVQIQAVGQSGLVSDFVSAGSAATLLEEVKNSVAFQDNTITLASSYGPISIFLPSGSIGSSTRMTLAVKTSGFAPPVSALTALKATNIGVEITYDPPTLLFKPVTITISYRETDLPPGMDRSRLIIALYDETSQTWAPLPSVSDTAGNRVTAQSWHLSTFQIMETATSAGLANVKIYPNPYKPSSVSDVMHFTNMPPYAKIKVYTFLGELVRVIKADINGMALWAGENDSGRKAASGVYLALIQTQDKKTDKLFKVVIER